MAESKKVLSVIMGGGRGTRLFPLTKERCKPAVPLAGKYRLVDIPISNCLNSDINRMFLLTQFQTASLHRHVQSTYHFDPFGGGFVDILAAEQTEKSVDWYQGTADAVRSAALRRSAAGICPVRRVGMSSGARRGPSIRAIERTCWPASTSWIRTVRVGSAHS